MDARLRAIYYLSLGVTGFVALGLPAILGDVPVQGALAAYAGLGLGIEAGKAWARWQARRSSRNGRARKPQPPSLDDMVVQALRKLGFSAAEARYWAMSAQGETLEERVRSALQAAARQ